MNKQFLIGLVIGLLVTMVCILIAFVIIIVTRPQILTNITATTSPSVVVSPTTAPTPTQTITVIPTTKPIAATTYKYKFSGVAVEYAPDPQKFVGLQSCNLEISTCEVNAVEVKYFPKVTIGANYQVSYNSLANCGAAAGTTYCEVVSPVEVKAL